MKRIFWIALLAALVSIMLFTACKNATQVKRTTPDTVVVLTSENFDLEVNQEKDFLVFVQFWAPWCGWCRKFNPVVDSMATLDLYRGKIKFTRCDTQEYEDLRDKFGVRGIPDARIFKNGQIIKTLKGYRPADQLTPELDKAIIESESGAPAPTESPS